MLIFPAIDIIGGKAVRLLKGDYSKKTVYSDNPLEVAHDFESQGAGYLHVVDLEGAKSGDTPNIETVKRLACETSLFTEIGGGIRNMHTVERYFENGVDRVILGTAAVTDEAFLKDAVREYGKRIAVGIDIKDGYVAIKGWTEKSCYDAFDFCKKIEDIGVRNVICTDISKDGAMMGINYDLYRQLSDRFSFDVTASGGVTSIEDIKKLSELDIYAAIIGKAYYTGAVSVKQAVEVAE